MKSLQLRHAATHEGVQLWTIGIGAMPVPEQERGALATGLLVLVRALSAREHVAESVWLEATHIHEGGTTELLGAHAREWVPRVGFGIHPEGPMPRMWTKDDFSGSAFHSKVPTFNNQVFEISRPAAFDEVVRTVAGRGVLMLVLTSVSSATWKQEMTQLFSPMVQEQAFHAYAYFVPLLSQQSATQPQLSKWLGSARVYLREDPESKGMLLFSRIPMEPILEGMKATQGAAGTWELHL